MTADPPSINNWATVRPYCVVSSNTSRKWRERIRRINENKADGNREQQTFTKTRSDTLKNPKQTF